MPRSTLVSQVMTKMPDVVAFHPQDSVENAARVLSRHRLGGAPVIDDDRTVVGLLNDDDLIVQEARLHVPTVISVLGAYIPVPGSQHAFEDELRKAVGATVGDVMSADPAVCDPDDTLEQVATVMHEHNISRLPVVTDGKLVGIVARGDLVKALLAPPPTEE